MAKKKSMDYVLGMITGASMMLALWACTGNELVASSTNVQDVRVVNATWEAVNVSVVE